MIDAAVSPLDAFVDALALRDYNALAATLVPDVRFRALLPPGFREAATRGDAIRLIKGWFEDADRFDLAARTVEAIVDRYHATYRIDCRENGVEYIVQQTAFATVSDRGIETLDLICSGFRPRNSS